MTRGGCTPARRPRSTSAALPSAHRSAHPGPIRTSSRSRAARAASLVSKAFDRQSELTQSVSSYFSASNEVSRWEFFSFVEENLSRYPGIRALSWLPRISAEDRRQHVVTTRTDGLFGYRIKERDHNGRLVTAADRDHYHPMHFIEPAPGSEPLMGYDLSTDLAFGSALAQARDDGRTVVVLGGDELLGSLEGAASSELASSSPPSSSWKGRDLHRS